MIQIKRFDISDVDAFNKFIKTVRLAGESPVKYNENSLFIFYDTDELFDKESKLQLLHRSLRVIETGILESRKEILMEEGECALLNSETKDMDEREAKGMIKLIKDKETITNSKKRLIKLEEVHAKAIRKLIKEVEKE